MRFERLKSRKFWITIVGSVICSALYVVDVPIPDNIINVIIAYIFGQGAVDVAKELRQKH